MERSDLLRLARRWRVILLAVVVCTGTATAVAFLQSPRYRSTVQLFVSAQGANAAGDAASALQGSEFTTARVQSYVELVKSPRLTGPVVSQLHLQMTPSALGSELSASAPANTVLINLSVTDRSPTRAQQIAQTVGTQFIALIDTLEASPRGQEPVKVSVSSPASFISIPVSPRKPLDIALGLFLGLILGLVAAQIRESMDGSIGSEDDISATFGLPVLASIPYDPTAGDGVSALSGSKAIGRLEALRSLRTALRYIDIDNPPSCIVITSSQPNEGKSITAVTLATVIADSGQNVILVEGDMRHPRLRDYTNLHASVEGLAEALFEHLDVDQLLCPVDTPKSSNDAGSLRLLPSGRFVPNPSELLGSERMKLLVAKLRALADIVIIDAPPLLPVTDAAVLATLSDGVVMIVCHGRTQRKGLSYSLGSLEQVSARVLGVVVNQAPTAEGYRAYGYGYGVEAALAPAASLASASPSSDSGTTLRAASPPSTRVETALRPASPSSDPEPSRPAPVGALATKAKNGGATFKRRPRTWRRKWPTGSSRGDSAAGGESDPKGDGGGPSSGAATSGAD